MICPVCRYYPALPHVEVCAKCLEIVDHVERWEHYGRATVAAFLNGTFLPPVQRPGHELERDFWGEFLFRPTEIVRAESRYL